LTIDETGHSKPRIADNGTYPMKGRFGIFIGREQLFQSSMLFDIEDIIFKSQKGAQRKPHEGKPYCSIISLGESCGNRRNESRAVLGT
jgi:hypothetical protein